MGSGGYRIRNQQAIHFVTFAVVEWVDVFSRRGYVDIVLDSLRYCQQHKGLVIHAWCLMTNHMHLVVSANDVELSAVLRDFKRFTSRSITKAMQANQFKESRRTWMLAVFQACGQANSRNEQFQFWQQELHPKVLYSQAFIRQKIEYIHRNPVVAGWVDRAEDYVWSSARDYSDLEGHGLIEVVKLY